jgi:hypothetical protein
MHRRLPYLHFLPATLSVMTASKATMHRRTPRGHGVVEFVTVCYIFAIRLRAEANRHVGEWAFVKDSPFSPRWLFTWLTVISFAVWKMIPL